MGVEPGDHRSAAHTSEIPGAAMAEDLAQGHAVTSPDAPAAKSSLWTPEQHDQHCPARQGGECHHEPGCKPTSDAAKQSRSRRKPRRAAQLGVTDEEYARMLTAQGGGCAICGAKPKTRRLHVDHDHASGAVRGLLCHRCNRALPTWVTERWLFKAAAYIGRTAA